MQNSIYAARSKLATAVRVGNDAAAEAARADLAFAKAEAKVHQATQLLPHPTPEQLDHLVALLRNEGN
jgi:hypothetical protein